MTTVAALAELIEEFHWQPANPNDLHQDLVDAHRLSRAMQSLLGQMAGYLLEDTGLNPTLAEAFYEAAAAEGNNAERLAEEVGGGVTGRGGAARPFDPQGRELTRWLSARDPDWQNGNQRRSWTG